MANEEHLEILKQGVEAWNRWREDNPDIRPDLRGANLTNTDLHNANLNEANLTNADLSNADLTGARFWEASFGWAVFWNTKLSSANFENAQIGYTFFLDVDLSVALNLDKVMHYLPSSISIDTLYKSGGKIPVEFLRGCGIPDDFITFIPSHFSIQRAIQFYSCFISYSTKDEEFAGRLYSRMRDEKLRVWFAPEEMKGGRKVYEELERAIQLQDRLLLVLSEESMKSEWVMTELRNARKAEIEENRRKLFPIRLVDFDAIKKWKCFDSDIGKDLAVEIREYHIPDFSNWKDHDAFEREFAKLLRDLRAEERK